MASSRSAVGAAISLVIRNTMMAVIKQFSQDNLVIVWLGLVTITALSWILAEGFARQLEDFLSPSSTGTLVLSLAVAKVMIILYYFFNIRSFQLRFRFLSELSVFVIWIMLVSLSAA